MIKILKDGVLPKDTLIHFIYNTTCDKCGCEFEFEIGDIKSQERHPGEENKDWEFYWERDKESNELICHYKLINDGKCLFCAY